MDTLTLKIIYMIGLLSSFFIRIPHQLENKNNKIADDRKTLQEKLLLFLMGIGMVLLPLLYVFTPLLNFANYTLPIWANIIGIFAFTIGVWLFWRSHHDLGKNWSVTLEVREGHTLVSDGIYQSIRHPMYTSVWLWAIAQFLLLNNWLAGSAAIVAFGIMYMLRVGNEEKMMLDQFGEAYHNYMQQTGRLLPKLF
jgi:protein-S-isoprenylcysteine O-methyltransferase Ste14